MPHYQKRWEEDGIGAIGMQLWRVNIANAVGATPHETITVAARTGLGAVALAEETQTSTGLDYVATEMLP